MKNLFSIGEVSKIKNITIKALRYYHKVGILIPKYIDEETGYRYYSIEQFIYIDVIKGCRALGTSIKELQEIFKSCDTDELLRFLKKKKIEAQDNINKMQEIINNIDNLNSSVEYSKNALINDSISIKYFEERYIVVVHCEESGSLKELIYYSNLDKLIEKNNIKTSMERGIIYNVDLEGQVEPKYAFSELGIKKNLYDDKFIKILPKGNYLTLSYTKDNEKERVNKLFAYIKENKLKVKNFIEIELFDDFFNTNSYSCQLQVFIES